MFDLKGLENEKNKLDMACGGGVEVEDLDSQEDEGEEEEGDEGDDEEDQNEEEDKNNLKKMLNGKKKVEIDESLFNIDDLQDLDEELEKLEI